MVRKIYRVSEAGLLCCTGCETEKPLADFYTSRRKPHYRQPCKTCWKRSQSRPISKAQRRKSLGEVKAARKGVLLELLGGKCTRCSEDDPDLLDFDHKDVNSKEFSVMAGISYAWERVVLEALKCQLLCVSCHRKKTKREKKIIIRKALATKAALLKARLEGK